MSDETARASLTRHVDLAMADAYVNGWLTLITQVLDAMRAEMPYADTVRLTLTCERKPDVEP